MEERKKELKKERKKERERKKKRRKEGKRKKTCGTLKKLMQSQSDPLM